MLTQAPQPTGMACELIHGPNAGRVKDTIEVKSPAGGILRITFQRTIRVPDNSHGSSELPPSMGTLPLYSVANHKDSLPQQMAVKGGLFLPMYRECVPTS